MAHPALALFDEVTRLFEVEDRLSSEFLRVRELFLAILDPNYVSNPDEFYREIGLVDQIESLRNEYTRFVRTAISLWQRLGFFITARPRGHVDGNSQLNAVDVERRRITNMLVMVAGTIDGLDELLDRYNQNPANLNGNNG